MKRTGIALVVAAVVAAGIGWIALNCKTGNEELLHHSAVPCSTFCGSEHSEADQVFLDAVLESPEVLDGEIKKNLGVRREAERHAAFAPAVPVCTLPVGRDRRLLSDIEKPPAPQPLAKPVAAESLHFWSEYASLRTDAVRNPNSPENRAGVVSLMQARQRRLGQK